MSLHRYFPITLAFFIGGGLLAGCARSGDAALEVRQDEAPIAVQTAQVQSLVRARMSSLPGTVEAVDRAVIAAETPGRVASLPVVLGQAVSAGEVLGTLHAPEVLARRDQARAGLEQIEHDLARERSLLDSGAATAERVRDLVDRRRIAGAALAEAEAYVAHLSIRAPFAGRITARHLEPGAFVSAGTPVLTLEGAAIRAVVAVPSSLPVPGPGSLLTVIRNDRESAVRVAEVAPAVDPTSRTRRVQLTFADDADPAPGEFIHVLWPAGEIIRLTLPSSALMPLGQLERVFVIEEGRARLRLIRTGDRDADGVTVLSGLNPGELVILAPPAALREGRRVEVAR